MSCQFPPTHTCYFIHPNGVKECLECHTLFVPDNPEMRKVYSYPQFKVIWLAEESQ